MEPEKTLYIVQCPQKRKYTLLSSQVLKTEGDQMESRGCATHSIEYPYNGGCGVHPTFPLVPLAFEYLVTKCKLSFGADCIPF